MWIRKLNKRCDDNSLKGKWFLRVLYKVIFVLLLSSGSLFGAEAVLERNDNELLRMNAHYIAGPEDSVDRQQWLDEVLNYRDRIREKLNLGIYDREDLGWVAGSFVCHFTFMYDSSFYGPEQGYKVEAFLKEGIERFGGYDCVLLWQG